MAGQLEIKDARLLFFQALENGIESGILSSDFVAKMEKEAAELSFGFAKRYYTIIHQAFLRQASFNVLGIMNLALELLSGGNVETAMVILKERSAVGLFREGWTRLVKLSKMAHELKGAEIVDIEKDYAELFSAEPDKEWFGLEEYEEEFSRISFLHSQSEVELLLIDKFAERSIAGEEEVLVNTIFFSILFSSKPHAPLLGDSELQQLVNQIAALEKEGAEKRMLFLSSGILSDSLQGAFQQRLSSVLDSFVEYKEIYRQKGALALKKVLFRKLKTGFSSDEISRLQYESFLQRLKDDQPSQQEILDFYLLEADVSQRMAVLEYSFSSKRSGTVTSDYLIGLLETLPSREWRGKIPWAKLNISDLKAIVNCEDTSPEILHDMRSVLRKFSHRKALSSILKKINKKLGG